jgi:hypothetical protein
MFVMLANLQENCWISSYPVLAWSLVTILWLRVCWIIREDPPLHTRDKLQVLNTSWMMHRLRRKQKKGEHCVVWIFSDRKRLCAHRITMHHAIPEPFRACIISERLWLIQDTFYYNNQFWGWNKSDIKWMDCKLIYKIVLSNSYWFSGIKFI